MWKKHVLLPLWAGLATYVPALNAYDATQAPQQGLYFIENKGQIIDQQQQHRNDLDFKLNAGKGLTIFFGSGKIEYQWSKPQSTAPVLTSVPATTDPEQEYIPVTYDLYRMEVSLVGANREARIVREGRHNYYEHYYLPSVPQEGAQAHAWQKITYKEVYPHIDWVFYFNAKGQLEHDFIVRPGGRIADIRLQYGGATQVQLLADGSLLARTPMGTAKEQAPIAYDGSGKVISSKFNLADNIVTFDVAAYSGTLTIDPIMEWGTYFGGPDVETGKALCADKLSYVYVTGTTGSLSNMATTGTYQATYGGGEDANGGDAFLCKWNKEGQLIWCTYFGGSAKDIVLSISCDTADKIYLGGYTSSKDVISTPGTHQEAKAGTNTGYDCFLAQFDSTGQRIWGTYYGGTGAEGSFGVGLAATVEGSVYMTGNTSSTAGISSVGAYQGARVGPADAFIAKFNNVGQVIWSTYYGGNNVDYPQGCASDSEGNIYITGYTQSASGIATSGSYQSVPNSSQDAFICKFDPGGQLAWGTYFGGENNDRGISIATSMGKVYIGGSTQSTVNIASSNAHQGQFDGEEDGLIIVLDTAGNLQWSTYYGGEDDDVILSVWSNLVGELYIAGSTASKNKMATPNAHKSDLVTTGNKDIFLAKFNQDGIRAYGTYFGGLDKDSYGYLTGDNQYNIYLSGQTHSTTGIASDNAYQRSIDGINDVVLARFNDCPKPVVANLINGPIEICDSSIQQYNINKEGVNLNYKWMLPESWILVAENDTLVEVRVNGSGKIQVVTQNDCGAVSDTQSLWVEAWPLPGPVILNNNFILSTSKSYANYQWIFEEEPIAGATKATYVATEDGTYNVMVQDGDGCQGVSAAVDIEGTTSIAWPNLSDVRQPYPNPAQNYITVRVMEAAVLGIYTLEGREIKSVSTAVKGDVTVSLDGIAEGMYLLKTKTGTHTWAFPFVKQR